MKYFVFFCFSLALALKAQIPVFTYTSTIDTPLASSNYSHVLPNGDFYHFIACSESYGATQNLRIEHMSEDGGFLGSSSYELPDTSLVVYEALDWRGNLYLFGTYFNGEIKQGGIWWAILSDELLLSEIVYRATDSFYAEHLGLSIFRDKIMIGGTLSNGAFTEKTFTLLLDDNMLELDWYDAYPDNMYTGDLVFLGDAYVLLGDGLWRYNMEHVLEESVLFQELYLNHQTSAFLHKNGSIYSFRRTYQVETGEKDLIVERWSTRLSLLGSLKLGVEVAVERPAYHRSVVQLPNGNIGLLGQVSNNMLDFPFVNSEASLIYWVISENLLLSRSYTWPSNTFVFPFSLSHRGSNNLVSSGLFYDVDSEKVRSFCQKIKFVSLQVPISKN